MAAQPQWPATYPLTSSVQPHGQPHVQRSPETRPTPGVHGVIMLPDAEERRARVELHGDLAQIRELSAPLRTGGASVTLSSAQMHALCAEWQRLHELPVAEVALALVEEEYGTVRGQYETLRRYYNAACNATMTPRAGAAELRQVATLRERYTDALQLCSHLAGEVDRARQAVETLRARSIHRTGIPALRFRRGLAAPATVRLT